MLSSTSRETFSPFTVIDTVVMQARPSLRGAALRRADLLDRSPDLDRSRRHRDFDRVADICKRIVDRAHDQRGCRCRTTLATRLHTERIGRREYFGDLGLE